MHRRTFLRNTTLASTAIAFPAILRSQTPSSVIRVAAVGTAGRGTELAVGMAAISNVDVVAVCDVDEKNAAKAAATVEKKAGKAPKAVKDFRTLLDSKDLDAITIATPDHWHAPAAILAINAGKHVYLEKPCSHNAQEGEWLVQAARKHNRVVQHGTQRRSWPGIREAMQKLQEGAIGRVLTAKSYYQNARQTIGKGKPAPVPANLDWTLWQGPAPEREFHDNYVHYNWHWFWHWGTGELGNNGVHMIDLCRWGLGVDYAQRVTSAGEKLRFPDDDQETPDTNTVSFDFGGKTITWECRSWSRKTATDPKYDCVFFGENGSLAIDGGGYVIFDLKGEEVSTGTGPANNATHLQNFADAIRGGATLNAEIEEGHKTTLLCHLGNIAWRTGQTLHPKGKPRIEGNPEAEKLWRREYREGWEPKV